MTQKITISVIGDSVTSIYFDKRLSEKDSVELEQLLMNDARLDTIGHFIKLNWPESIISVEQRWGGVGRSIMWGDYK